MGSSKVRKEEAELRQIAKRARTARKEEKKRIAAQKRREGRQKTMEEAQEKDCQNALSSIRLKLRRNAVVMAQKDVEKLHRKLHLSTSGDSKPEEGLVESESSSNGRKLKKSSSVDPKNSADESSSLASPTESILEPNYRVEIHYKHKEVLVDVVLHHIPHQKINIKETTPTQLVVDTTQHTKKYRLVLPMPSGLRVNSKKATYELMNGVLHCRLPILNEEIPAELQKEWDALREKIRAQRALRFRVDKTGDLVVRVRKTLLAKSPAEQARLQAARTDKRPREEAHSKDGLRNVDETCSGNAVPEAATTVIPSLKRKGGELKSNSSSSSGNDNAMKTEINFDKNAKEGPTLRKKSPATDAGKSAKLTNTKDKKADVKNLTTSNTTTTNKNRNGNSNRDVFAEEHSKALSIAKAVAAGVRHSIREKVQLAKEVQRKRLERVNVRSERQEQRRLREAESFKRVLEEQKRQLLARATLKASAEEAAKRKEQDRKSKQGPAKSVSFKD
ncbi:unnamed protein product [Phytomonas sp. EM1]|nr:unnamed protein product [Phytomonas sp. EM1]|eukprot:CCW65509.1 unnamed protein product [Phytomonas sp. isolate EM1]